MPFWKKEKSEEKKKKEEEKKKKEKEKEEKREEKREEKKKSGKKDRRKSSEEDGETKRTEIRTERTEVKTEAKPEVKTEAKPEVKTEAKIEVKEDTDEEWVKVKLGDPLPDHSLLLRGADNQYPAVWVNTDGKAVAGRVFQHKGYVDGMFADEGKAITGLGLKGDIYMLKYEGNFAKNKFWYDWVVFTQRFEPHLTVVKKGGVGLILIKNKNSAFFLGHWNGTGNKGTIGYGREWEIHIGTELNKAYILCRNISPPPRMMDCNPADLKPKVVQQPLDLNRFTGFDKVAIAKPIAPPPPPPPPPATPEGPTSPVGGPAAPQIILSPHDDLWYDIRSGLQAPPNMLLADGRPLKGTGKNYVALWYWNGVPTLGRAYENSKGVIEGSFARGGYEHRGKRMGNWQLLRYTNPSELFFEYSWKPYKDANKEAGAGNPWSVVKLGDDIPIIIEEGTEEILGRFDFGKGTASYGKNGQEISIEDGRKINNFKVLCRKELQS